MRSSSGAGIRWGSGHDAGEQQQRAEPAVEEEGILSDLPEPAARRDLLYANDTLHTLVGDPHGQVERDRKGRDMLGLEEASESCGSAVQTPCNPEHLPGLLPRLHPVHRDRDFLPEDDHGPGGREELQHRGPVCIGGASMRITYFCIV